MRTAEEFVTLRSMKAQMLVSIQWLMVVHAGAHDGSHFDRRDTVTGQS